MGAVPFLLFGNLNNGVGNYGLSYANVNNALSNANWNIASRPSVNSANVFLLYITRTKYIRAAAKIGSYTTGLVGKRTSRTDKRSYNHDQIMQTH